MRVLSRRGWAVYAAGWTTLAACFAAASWLRDGGPSWAGAAGALRVMLPAALAGVAVVVAAARLPLVDLRAPATLAPHVAGAALFPVVWVAAVSGMAAASRGVTSGVWSWCLPPEHVLHWHALTGALAYVTLAAAVAAVRVEARRRRAERRLLGAQLEPHFLFNTLHALFALARVDADAGEAGVDRLSRVLRHTLRAAAGDGEPTTSLAAEWSFAADVLALEQLRLGERVRVTAELMPEALRLAIPPLVLQPLVENALRHAVAPRADGATIRVAATVRGGVLRVRVADDGPGCAPERLARAAGVGLRAVRARLEPVGGRLLIDTAPGAGFAATLLVPAREAR